MASRPFSAADRLKPGRPGFYLAGLLLLALAYAVVFVVTGNTQPAKMALDVLANMVPVAIGALAIRALWRGPLADRGALFTLAGHLLLAALFSLFWFWLLMTLLAITSNGNPVVFSVAPFLGPAAAWQLYQGVLLYAVIAMAVHLEIAATRFTISDDQSAEICGPGRIEAPLCPTAMGVGLGWLVYETPQETVVMHGGADWGERTLGFCVPDRDIGVVIFTNGANGQKVIRDIVRTLYDNESFNAFMALQAGG